MAKHITEDEVNLLINAKVSQAQQEIRKFEKDIDKLEGRNKSLLRQMDSLELAGKKDTDSWKKRRAEYSKNVKEIKRLKDAVAEETKKLDINSLSMAQLRKQAKDLQKQLDNTAKAIHPEEYDKLQKQLTKVNGRMHELRESAKGLKESFLDETTFSFLKGSVFVKLGELVGQVASYAVGKVKEIVNEGIEMAKSADGITHAFERLNRPDILDKLREATHGTVNDVELMKAAVQAKDFRLPLDQLGKYLEFAQLKAQQTGQSVDYMTNSIITGLGRKSLMILDNLGLSAAQVKEEMAKGGDMATAVGRIIEKQLAAQGEHYETAAEREQRAIVDVQNAQKELGDEMLPLAEKGSNMWQRIQVSALKFFTYLVKAFKQGVARFVDLYNSSATVRTGIALITVNLKNAWTAIKLFVNVGITAFKQIGKQLLSLGKMVEGIFTLDWDKVKEGFSGMFTSAWSGIKDQISNFRNWGKEVGQNFVDGYHEAVDGHITAPSFDKGGDGTSPGTGPGDDDSGGDGGGKKTKKDNADQELLKQLKASRQKQLDQEKYFHEESVRAYKKQLADKQISQQQFDTIQLSLAVTQADRILAAEKAQLESIKAADFKNAKERQQAIEEQQRNIAKAENDASNARLAAYQDFQKKMEHLESSGMSERERMEQDHALQLQALKGYYQAALQYAQEHNEELVSIDLAYQKAKEKLEKDYTEKLEKEKLSIRQQYGLVTMQDQYNQELKLLKQHLAQKLLTQEEYEKAVANLDRQYEDKKFQVRQQYGLVKPRELYERQKEDLQAQYDEGLLSKEDYEAGKLQIATDYYKQEFDRYHAMVSDAISALQDAEMANIDAKYDAEIEAARKAGKDTTDLENKKANEQLKVQKKYADINFAIKASQIIADTSVAIMKALGELGPIAGPIAAALMGVTGAAQLAAANAERLKVKRMTLNGSGTSASGTRVAVEGREDGGFITQPATVEGRESGGYVSPQKVTEIRETTVHETGHVTQPATVEGRESGGYVDVERKQDGKPFHAKYDPKKRGYVTQPTVIVGEGPRPKEWIASNAAVENPTIAPFIDVLDRVQRAGQVRTFDFMKYIRQQQARGFADGGSLSPMQPKAQPSTFSSYDFGQTKRLADILDRIEKNGLPVLLGLDEFDAKRKLQEQSRNIAKKG